MSYFVGIEAAVLLVKRYLATLDGLRRKSLFKTYKKFIFMTVELLLFHPCKVQSKGVALKCHIGKLVIEELIYR